MSTMTDQWDEQTAHLGKDAASIVALLLFGLSIIAKNHGVQFNTYTTQDKRLVVRYRRGYLTESVTTKLADQLLQFAGKEARQAWMHEHARRIKSVATIKTWSEEQNRDLLLYEEGPGIIKRVVGD